MKTTEFMQIWQSRFGTLLQEYRDEFIESPITAEIVKYSPGMVKAAVKKGDASLSGILEHLRSGKIKPEPELLKQKKSAPSVKTLSSREIKALGVGMPETTSFIPSDYYLVDPGAYQLGHTIYSIRRDKKSRILQAWLFDSSKGCYRRPFFASEEHEILSKLKPANRLTLKTAEKFSLETGMCCHCGRVLTAKKSISRGMGPVCKSHYQ